MSLKNRLKEQTKTDIIKVKKDILSKYINSTIDFVKIDVEGSEFDVLSDLDKTRKINYINEFVIEYHYSNKNKMSKILNILEKNNYNYEILTYNFPPFKKEKIYNLLIHAYKN